MYLRIVRPSFAMTILALFLAFWLFCVTCVLIDGGDAPQVTSLHSQFRSNLSSSNSLGSLNASSALRRSFKLGLKSSCSADSDCPQHSVCVVEDKECKCKLAYHEEGDEAEDKCVKKSCTQADPTTCGDFPNYSCSDGMCTCNSNWASPDKYGTSCVQPNMLDSGKDYLKIFGYVLGGIFLFILLIVVIMVIMVVVIFCCCDSGFNAQRHYRPGIVLQAPSSVEEDFVYEEDDQLDSKISMRA